MYIAHEYQHFRSTTRKYWGAKRFTNGWQHAPTQEKGYDLRFNGGPGGLNHAMLWEFQLKIDISL